MKVALILLASAGTLSFIGPFESSTADADNLSHIGSAQDFGNNNLAGQAWTVIEVTSPESYLTPVPTNNDIEAADIQEQAVSPTPVATA